MPTSHETRGRSPPRSTVSDNASLPRRGCELQRHILGELGDLQRLGAELDLPRVELRQLEELSDQALEAGRVAQAHLQESCAAPRR